MTFLETMRGEFNRMRARTFASDGYEGVTHAGVAVVAADTGRFLLAQRAMDETDDPDVRETYEWPGGTIEPGEDPFDAALREFSEEVGLDLPEGMVFHGWRAGPEDNYQGFAYLIDTEFDLSGFTPNEETQAVGWFTPEDTTEVAIRPEMADFDWSMLAVPEQKEPEMADELDGEAVERIGELVEEPEFSLIEMATGPIPIHGVLAPENTESGDERAFNEGSMTSRPLRLPFSWQKVSAEGHNGSLVIGSMDRMMRKDGLIHWEGLLMPSVEADSFVDLLVFFGKFGVSVDGDRGALDAAKSEETGVVWFEAVRAAGLTAVAIPAFAEAYVALGPHPDMPADDSEEALVASGVTTLDMAGRQQEFDRGPGWVTHPRETKRIHDYWTKPGQPGYQKIRWGSGGDFRRCVAMVGEKIAKNSPEDLRFMKQICAQWHHDALGYWPGELGKPGNAPNTPENRRRAARHAASAETVEASDSLEAERDAVVKSVEGLAVPKDGDAEWEAVLVSSVSATIRPPLRYFHRQDNTDAVVIEDPDENGFRHTYGYAAEWGVCHIGMDGRCVEPPETGSDDYPEFHLGRTKVATEEGEGYITTGLLTYAVGHRDAKKILTESATQQHFDNIKNAWASVRVGEDDRGIWFSGVVLPKVDEEDVTLIQASGQVSGEWKHGAMRACLTVGVPGFPVMRASAEYDDEGNVVALAASAFGSAAEVNGVENSPCAETPPTAIERMAALRTIDAEVRFEALRAEWALSEGVL